MGLLYFGGMGAYYAFGVFVSCKGGLCSYFRSNEVEGADNTWRLVNGGPVI